MRERHGYRSEQNRNLALAMVLDSINAMQRKVYDTIVALGRCSNEDIAKELGVFPNQVTPRVYELREQKLVEYAGDAKSHRSGRTVTLWRASQLDNQYTLFPES